MHIIYACACMYVGLYVHTHIYTQTRSLSTVAAKLELWERMRSLHVFRYELFGVDEREMNSCQETDHGVSFTIILGLHPTHLTRLRPFYLS
jgi:hypothetical protein